MKKFLVALLLLAAFSTPAMSQQSKAALNTEINTNWPDNTSGAITPALLRTTVSDIVASYVDWLTCTAQGGILYWGAGGTPSCLAAGTSGYVLQTQGAAANPIWAANTASALTMTTNERFIGNNAGANKAAQELSANTLFDWIGTTRGSVFYRGASAWATLSPGTVNFPLTSGGAGADPNYTGVIAGVRLSTTGEITTATRFFAGANGAVGGSLQLYGATSGDGVIKVPSVISPSTTFQLPPNTGTTGFVLQTDGAGVTSWANPAAGGTVTSITCGSGLTCTGGVPITTAGTITPDVATAANIWNATSYKMVDSFGLTAGGQLISLTHATPTVAVDFSTGVNFNLALTGNTQLGDPSNAAVGRTGCIFITKDATSRTLSYGANWKFAGGTKPTLTTTTTTQPDVLCYLVRSSTFIWGAMTANVQ